MAGKRRTPLPLTISAWAVPVLVLGQFALVAVVPVITAVIVAFTRTTDRAIRTTAVALAVVYAVPLAAWIIRPEGSPSLSKHIHPVAVALIVVASVALIAAVHRPRTRLGGAAS
jgi:FAD/FMN-containing dehydrogenase